MSNKTIEKSKIRKKLIVRLILLVLYLSILLYFYYLLFVFDFNPFIILLLIILIFFTTIGPFLRRNKRSLYSRMFPNRSRRISLTNQKKRITIMKEKEVHQMQPKISKPINLDFNYRKPIINKCGNCGNIVPSFVKKCPFCKNQIIY